MTTACSRRRAWLLATIVVALGCSRSLVHLAEQGDHEAVIERAAQKRWPPRRKAARAFASALVHEGDVERARDVLLGDYRRGGQLESLVALADLERRLGRDGVAAAHYAEVVSGDRTRLRRRADVCALFDERAASWVGVGEGAAALDDLDRVDLLCGRSDAELRRRGESLLRATIRRRTAAPSRPRVTAAASTAAPVSSIEATRRELLARGASRPARETVDALLADLRGEAGARLVDDDELRLWLGELEPAALRQDVAAQPAAEAAYLRLRIDRALGSPPDGKPATPIARLLWVDRASVATAAVRWRLLAYVGDLVAAEQDLVARWRPTAPRAGATSTDTVVSVDRHWSLRVPIDAANRNDLLVFARLRDAGDDLDLGIELRRRVAQEVGDPAIARAVVVDEATHALGWGRAWIALAITDALDSADVEPVRRAAASAIVLGEAVCGGPCPEDVADLEAIERTLGAAWIEAARARVRSWALDRAQTPPVAGACPALAEVLAPGARTPLARAVERYGRGESIGTGRALVAAIEADPTLGCASRFAVPLLVAHQARTSAARLADFMAFGTLPATEWSLLTHAALALLGGQSFRGEQLAIAAAAAGDAPVMWRRVARLAHAVGNRDVEVLALREALLHTPQLDDDALRRAMVVSSLVDAARSWGPGQTEAGREATRRILEERLDEVPAERRWSEREAVLWAVHRAALSVEQRARLGEILGVSLAEASAPAELERAMWSDRRIAAAIRERTIAAPPAWATVFADPRRMTATRLALGEDARDWAVRRRAALGASVVGTTAERALAAQQLVTMTEGAPRDALVRLLLARPAALAADTGAAAVVVDDEELLLHVLFELDIGSALWPEALPGSR
jgi:hypothetical protein